MNTNNTINVTCLIQLHDKLGPRNDHKDLELACGNAQNISLQSVNHSEDLNHYFFQEMRLLILLQREYMIILCCLEYPLQSTIL